MDLNRLGRGQIGNAYARLHGIEDLNSVPTLAPEILPVTSIWERDEFWALLGGKLVTAKYVHSAPGAGNVACAQLANPPGDQKQIVLLERILIASAVLMEWYIGAGISVISTLVDDNLRDQRMNAGLGVGGVGSGMAVARVGFVAAFSTTGGAMLGPCILPMSVILPPASEIVFRGPDNGAINVTLEWRERPCTEQELSLF